MIVIVEFVDFLSESTDGASDNFATSVKTRRHSTSLLTTAPSESTPTRLEEEYARAEAATSPNGGGRKTNRTC